MSKLTPQEFFTAYIAGKKLRQSDWPAKHFIYRDEDNRACQADDCYYTLDIDDIFLLEWELYAEERNNERYIVLEKKFEFLSSELNQLRNSHFEFKNNQTNSNREFYSDFHKLVSRVEGLEEQKKCNSSK